MFGLNIDPRNPHGNPTPATLHELGVEMVRFTFKDATPGNRPDHAAVQFYRQQLEELANSNHQALVVLSEETTGDQLPATLTLDESWEAFIQLFVERAAEIAKTLARWQPAFQIWAAPAWPTADDQGTNALPPAVFGQLLHHTYTVLKQVDANLTVVAGGLVATGPTWLAEVNQALAATQFPADGLALHLQAKPSTFTQIINTLNELITDYRQVIDLPVWLAEVRAETTEPEEQADFLRNFYQAVSKAEKIAQVFWYCYADGMAYPFGLVDITGQPKPAYAAYRAATTPAKAGSGQIMSRAAAPTVVSAAAVSLDRLHQFAQYFEQNLIFGNRDYSFHRQMEIELRGNRQRLSRVDIWHLMRRLLNGSDYTVEQSDIEGLDALQAQKDLYGVLRALVLAAHQKTYALSGRIGVHVRISAETDANAATNTEAVLQILQHLTDGNRLVVMDAVKAVRDEGKLRGPDIFETNIYGQHRNGLIDNHAWNLQRLVRNIRDRGFQDRVLLLMRLDGPDAGANVNIFDGRSVELYELAIFKFIRYLEAVLPDVVFKLVLGNEPDLPHERPWSDVHADPRSFTINHYAPALGVFLKRLARRRPDITFICPALSANLKHDQLAYYQALFGRDRPQNLVAALHGYAGDVAAQPPGQQNLLEQLTDSLRRNGNFQRISGTEIGSSHPFSDGETLSDKNRFEDVVLWLLLSTLHRTPPGQDNNWAFYTNPQIDDPTARNLSYVVNRSEQRILRNIRERGGGNLQIIRNHAGQRPAYAVDYLSHNTPTQMKPGEIRSVTFTLRNTSHRTWPNGGPYPVRLGYHWYTPDGREVPADLWEDLRTSLPQSLAPGDSATLTARLGAPRTAGRYEVRWDLVEELQTWFAWQGVPTLNVGVDVRQVEPPPGGLQLSASHNNRQEGPDNLRQAIDNDPATRWSSQTPQRPGMWVEIDLGSVRSVSRLMLDTAKSPLDYPRGYIVKASTDRQNWTTLAQNPNNNRALDLTFSPRSLRYFRIEQTGSDQVYWWSIHNVIVELAGTPRLTVRASHNNVQNGADNLAQAFDSRAETRWSSRAPQQPGMWFEIELERIYPVRGLALDTTGSPNDYPRGYVVRVSTDRNQWAEVARNDQNNGPLDVNFSPREARFIRIEQTGRSEQWWWSIHEVTVKTG